MDLQEKQSIAISDFKAHCTEHLRMVEQTGLPIEITRHGKVIAQVMPPDKESPTMAEWIGSGAGTMIEGAEDLFDEPTWQPGDWNMERDDEEL